MTYKILCHKPAKRFPERTQRYWHNSNGIDDRSDENRLCRNAEPFALISTNEKNAGYAPNRATFSESIAKQFA